MNQTQSMANPTSFDQDDNIQSRANLLATRLRKLAANLEDAAAQDVETIEGMTILENVLGVQDLANEFLDWYQAE